MYNRYQQTTLQALPLNQKITVVLKDISKKLQTSDHLFRTYKVSQSIEIGEKAIYKAIALSDIMDEYINQTLAQAGVTGDLKSGLEELKRHFDILHKSINRYVIGRNQALLKRIFSNLEAMEKFWGGLGE